MGWSWRMRRVKPRSHRSGSPSTAGIKLEFHGARITSDGGLLAYRELDDVFDLTAMAASTLGEGRRGKNIRHRLLGLLRQAVYGRLAGYEDVNDAERLAHDPAMRAIVGRRASTSSRPRPARWAASRPSGWPPRRTSRHSRISPGPGSTGCIGVGRRTASSSTWIAPEPTHAATAATAPGMSIGSNDRWQPDRRGTAIIDRERPNAARNCGARLTTQACAASGHGSNPRTLATCGATTHDRASKADIWGIPAKYVFSSEE